MDLVKFIGNGLKTYWDLSNVNELALPSPPLYVPSPPPQHHKMLTMGHRWCIIAKQFGFIGNRLNASNWQGCKNYIDQRAV